jgi:hypothetical protein
MYRIDDGGIPIIGGSRPCGLPYGQGYRGKRYLASVLASCVGWVYPVVQMACEKSDLTHYCSHPEHHSSNQLVHGLALRISDGH